MKLEQTRQRNVAVIVTALVLTSGLLPVETAGASGPALFEIQGSPANVQGIGVGTHKIAVGQTIANADIAPGIIHGITLFLSKKGNPTDSIVIALRSEQFGANLTSATIPVADLTISSVERDIMFPTPILTNMVSVVHITRTGPLNASDYAQVANNASNPYTNGQYFECNATSCFDGGAPNYDLPLTLNGATVPALSVHGVLLFFLLTLVVAIFLIRQRRTRAMSS